MLSVCIVMLYWQEEGEWGRVQCGGGGVGNEAVDSEPGPAGMRIRNRVQRAAITSKGFFLIKTILVHLNILYVMYLSDKIRKYSFCAG
jgi:hypothetical protein